MILSAPVLHAQRRSAEKKAEKTERKLDRKKRKQERQYERDKKKARERHYEMQSDKTKEGMKASEKRCKNYYKRKTRKDFFIKRWIKKYRIKNR